jgi:hypothetical protein
MVEKRGGHTRATSRSYTTPPATVADDGSQFQAVVSNPAGMAVSHPAKLSVVRQAAPVITTQPVGQTVQVGETATFTVAASGAAPLTYQWQKNGAVISGATSASYTTPPATTADNNSQFQVVVSNSAGSTTSNPAILTISGFPAITTQPVGQTVQIGQSATFAVVATGAAPLSYQWQKNGTAISGATSANYTTPAASVADNGSQFQVVVSNSAGTVTSNPAILTVNPTLVADVVTYHNDNARTGQNLNESILTPANVNWSSFGKLNFFPVDGKVDAQPLCLSNLTIAGALHNVLYVATEHDSVYAFDADTGAIIWQVSVLGTGETPSDDHGCNQVTPEIGITATGVIDRTRGPNGVIYLTAMSKDASGNYFQRLHALDITTGGELFGGPQTIQASFPGTGANSSGGIVIFDPSQYKERASLLLLNGVVYFGFSSHCDFGIYTGWIMGYDASTLAQTTVLNVTPNGSEGSIWMSGGGLAADSSGNIFLLDANGTFDTTLDTNGFPSQHDFGNSFLKLSTSGGLAVADYFATFDTVTQSNLDNDLGSGGVLLLPDLIDGSGQVQHLAVGAGKDARIYVVNRDKMGKFNPASNNIYQEIQGTISSGGVFASPAYFNNNLYYGSRDDSVKAFGITNASLTNLPSSQTSNRFPYPGATPGISANGTSGAILWAVENGPTAVLHAYDATNLGDELYNSNQATSGRDQFGAGNKFITPTIANGKVYVGTTNGVAVFGLLTAKR